MARGHEVGVLIAADEATEIPPYMTSAGGAIAFKYNGSVARMRFGPVAAAKVRRWLVAGEFDEAQPIVWEPFVEHIPDVRSHVFADASHCSHLEKPEEFRSVIAAFLTDVENKETHE